MAIDFSCKSDDELARLCREGVEDAFRELYDRYKRRIIIFACRMLGDRDAAADVLQETFQYFFRKVPDYRAEGRLGALLFRVARNLCLNRLKKSRRMKTAPLDEALVVPGDYSGSAINSVEKRELQDKVIETLKNIPPIYSEVIILRILEGLSYAEISGIADCPEGTVKSRLHNGLELLRKEVARAGFE